MVISTLRRIVFFGSVCIFLGSAGGGSGNQEKRQKPVLTEEVPKITVERVAADTTGQKEDSGTPIRIGGYRGGRSYDCCTFGVCYIR